MSRAIRILIVGGAAFLALALACAYAGKAPPTSGRESAVVLTAAEVRTVEQFETRLKEYERVHEKLESTLPGHGRHATPEQIDEYQLALGALIKAARPSAKQGDFFTPDTEAIVKRTLEAVLSGPDGKTIRSLIMDENPGVPNLGVNDRYPDSIPLSTMPRRVLKTLPKLDDDLEYRFAGERLVLMDRDARIIIDFTGDVLP